MMCVFARIFSLFFPIYYTSTAFLLDVGKFCVVTDRKKKVIHYHIFNMSEGVFLIVFEKLWFSDDALLTLAQTVWWLPPPPPGETGPFLSMFLVRRLLL